MDLNENVDLNWVRGSRSPYHLNDPHVANVLLDFNTPAKPYCLAFQKNRAARKELLANGTLLWKITEYPLQGSPKINTRTGKPHVTEWWLPESALELVKDRCIQLGVTLDQYARARLAVDHAWNKMTSLLIARLSRPVYSFQGETKYQPFNSAKSRGFLKDRERSSW